MKRVLRFVVWPGLPLFFAGVLLGLNIGMVLVAINADGGAA